MKYDFFDNIEDHIAKMRARIDRFESNKEYLNSLDGEFEHSYYVEVNDLDDDFFDYLIEMIEIKNLILQFKLSYKEIVDCGNCSYHKISTICVGNYKEDFSIRTLDRYILKLHKLDKPAIKDTVKEFTINKKKLVCMTKILANQLEGQLLNSKFDYVQLIQLVDECLVEYRNKHQNNNCLENVSDEVYSNIINKYTLKLKSK